jgi:uncharacterized protein (TIGR00369 family)
MQPVMTVAELTAFLDHAFPQIHRDGRVFSVESVAPGEAVVRLDASEVHLRPGGTVSGPTLFSLADLTAYVAILAQIGPVALAVTTNVSINFLRKPPPGPLLARGRLLKLGKRLAVAEVAITPPGEEEPVAQATATYSIPPPSERTV